jgi:hypothetical protein
MAMAMAMVADVWVFCLKKFITVLTAKMGLTICHTDEFVQSHFLDGNLNPISNPTPP